MTEAQRLRAWTSGRQFRGGARSPLEALRSAIAVYSSHPTAPMSLAARCPGFTPEAFVAMETNRRAIRVPAMRGSIFLVATEDASKIFAATRDPKPRFEAALRYAGAKPEEYARLKPRILDVLREPLTPEELRDAVKTKVDLSVVARLMSREGLTLRVSGSLRTDALKYVSTRSWLGNDLPSEDPEASLRWLAREYLHAFGPARIADFAWWSGVTKKLAAAAISTCPTVDVGEGRLLLAEDRPAFARTKAGDEAMVAALPKWDALTMAYPPDGRERFLDREHLSKAYTARGDAGATSGDGRPLLLRDGGAVAAWSHRFERDAMKVEISPFGGRMKPDLFSEALSRLAAAVGISRVEISSAGK